jgi:endonuclease/exonuclease/phosphatase (EEP) superfamily protein YafD
MTGPSPDATRRRWLTPTGLILAAAPWLWFLVRDRGGEVLDPVAVGMPIVLLVALVLAAIAAILRRRLLLLFAVSTAAMCVCTIVAPRLPQSSPAPDPAIRIATANVYDGNPTPEATIAALRARSVDVLATVEMDDAFWQQLDGIDALPYRVVKGELGVHARWPLTLMSAQGLPRSRILRIRVDAPDAPFVLYVAHALNPLHDYSTFADQRAFARAIVAATAREQLPVVVVGDFNTSDRASSERIYDGPLRDAMRSATFAASTYFGGWWPLLLLRIDHVWTTPDWCGADPSTFALPGSDHHGLQVSVGPCP